MRASHRVPHVLLTALALGGCDLLDDALDNASEMCATEVFEVTTTNPGLDPEALCTPDAETCTLRSALNSIAFCSDDVQRTIRLEPSLTYTLDDANTAPSFLEVRTRELEDRVGQAALPIVTGSVRIEAQGSTIEATDAAQLFIVAEGGSLELREAQLLGEGSHNAGTMVVEDFTVGEAHGPLFTNEAELTLRGGEIADSEVFGTLIDNRSDAELVLEQLRFADLTGVTAVHNQGTLEASGLTLERIAGVEPGLEFVLSVAGVHNQGTARIEDLQATGITRTVVISSEDGDLDLIDSQIRDATAWTDAAGIEIRSGSATLSNTQIGQSTGELAGAVLCGGGSLTLLNTSLTHSTARDPNGAGGLAQLPGCSIDLSGTTITDNTPADCQLAGSVVDGGGNSDSDGSCQP